MQQYAMTRISLILIIVAVALFAWVAVQHSRNKPLAATASAPTQTPVQFDFYTVLPKMAVSTPGPVTQQPGAVPPIVKKPSTVSAVPVYVLQIAALRQPMVANRLVEQMRRAGFSVFIQTYQNNAITWYRVMIGPYATQDLARHNQERLKALHINSLVVTMQPKSG